MSNSDAGARAATAFIDAEAVLRLTPMPRLIEAMARAFTASGGDLGPERQIIPLQNDVTMLVMPAGGRRMAGVKVVTVNPEARPAVTGIYLLIDAVTGALRATIDANMLTPRRTAAASGLACDLLAKRDARRLLMVGTGTLSQHLVEAHSAVRNIEEIAIWGRSLERAEAVAAELRGKGYPASRCDDLEAGVAQADIVSAATLSHAPLIFGKWLKAGTHLDLVGAFKPQMCEADPECYARAQVFVDTREGAFAEAGDMLQAIAAGQFHVDKIAADLAELCAGATPGRRDAEAITLFKSVGTALEDLAAAEFIMEEAGHG
ncbi:ornithine cyclodeaminase family protein [Sphingopyxis panaciterrae]